MDTYLRYMAELKNKQLNLILMDFRLHLCTYRIIRAFSGPSLCIGLRGPGLGSQALRGLSQRTNNRKNKKFV